jgi:hypothetical protein
MTQYARPDSDVSDGNWQNSAGNNTDLYSYIDEASSPDGTYIAVTDNMMGTPQAVTVGLGDVTDPDSSSDHKVVVRAKESGGMGFVTLSVTLKSDGSVTIKTQNFTPAGTFSNNTMTLDTEEADNIGDYSTLELEITATDNMSSMTTTTVSQAYFECPDASVPPPATVAKNQPDSFAMFVD